MELAAQNPPDVGRISELVRPICDRHLVSRMQVFGSVASAEDSAGSDVDFLVEFLPDAHAGLLEMAGLKEELELRLGCSVDLVSRVAIERSRNPYRKRSILASPVTVYAR
jgi:predicted nucleotidyltransferase